MNKREKIGTHWEGCWKTRDHWECAVARAKIMEKALELLIERVEKQNIGVYGPGIICPPGEVRPRIGLCNDQNCDRCWREYLIPEAYKELHK